MTAYSPLSAAHDPAGHLAEWALAESGPTPGALDTVTIRWENEGFTVTGTLEHERVEYVMRLSSAWQLRQFILFRDLEEPDLWLATDGHGRWGEMNGAHRTELDGCRDLILDGAAVSHALVIRRLPLHVGHTAELPVIVVDTDSLDVTTRLRRYTRTADREWTVDDGEGEIRFEVDEHGLPRDLPGQSRRVR